MHLRLTCHDTPCIVKVSKETTPDAQAKGLVMISIVRSGKVKTTDRGLVIQVDWREGRRIKSEQGGMVARFQVSFDGCIWNVTDMGKTFERAGQSWQYIYVEKA